MLNMKIQREREKEHCVRYVCHWRLLLYLLLYCSYKKTLLCERNYLHDLRTCYDTHSVVSFHRSLKMERYNQYKNRVLEFFVTVYNGNIF